MSGMKLNPKTSITGAFLAFMLVIGWFLRPWLHGLVMGLYRNPASLYMFLAIGVIIIVQVRKPITSGRRAAFPAILGIMVLLSIFASALASPFSNTSLYKTYHPSEITGELDLSTGYIRILPKFTAYRYAIDTIEYARYTLSAGHLTMLNGTPVWGFYIVPDGAWNAIRLKDRGGAPG
ncbi:hypothetical protein [Palaeococcus ferrophilus]|uniref:hypothetical protein n=1 Tax=Palaeococcus ferrophilus TaxID=83868 RepID=UPI001FE0DFEB|nr:hypothetical protein [Palaeococcus ferrophilus]